MRSIISLRGRLLALIMTPQKKKVLIIGADLRNPQLHKYVGLLKEKRGLTNYLFDQEVELESIINKNTLDNQYLDTIISGSMVNERTLT